MRALVAFIALAVAVAACQRPAEEQKQEQELPALPGMLELSVLDSVSDSNTARVDSAVDGGNAYDLAVAFHYYFHLSGSDRGYTARAIEIYDKLKAAAPDNYGTVLYDVSKDLERLNYGRMVDRHVDYLRSVSQLPEAEESVSR